MRDNTKQVLKNKNILVTGGTGSIGSGLVQQLLNYDTHVIRVFSNDENATFQLQQKLRQVKKIRFLIGDIRDKDRVIRAMENIDIVYHAAALKHVPLCEYNPFEAIKTNVLGTQNVIEAALATNVKKVINISTDKAVNPINTMGATKLLSEKLITDANFYKGLRKTIFSSVRFGNVTFSRGSIIPLIESQIRKGNTVTITDPHMTRFLMSIPETADLIFKATQLAQGGEIFILKMPVVKIGDLIDVIIENFSVHYGRKPSDIKKVIIGSRPGEKIFEELMIPIEAQKSLETDEMFIVKPQIEIPGLVTEMRDYPGARMTKMKIYSSKDIKPLTKKMIAKLIF